MIIIWVAATFGFFPPIPKKPELGGGGSSKYSSLKKLFVLPTVDNLSLLSLSVYPYDNSTIFQLNIRPCLLL